MFPAMAWPCSLCKVHRAIYLGSVNFSLILYGTSIKFTLKKSCHTITMEVKETIVESLEMLQDVHRIQV